MSENQVQRPFKSKPRRAGGPDFRLLEEDLERDRQDRRRRRNMIAIAVVVHLLLLVVSFPQLAESPERLHKQQGKTFVIQQLRFKPPAPKPAKPIPKKQAKKIPIPDPTPDDPEPIVREELVLEVDLDLPEIEGDSLFAIPDAPPGGPTGPVLQLGGDIVRPEKISAPQPGYTEEARAARVQGIVVVQGIIDEEGKVIQPKILKGLPLGLSESATKTIQSWRYKPALKNGQPVAVYMTFTVSFSLQ